MAEYIPPARQLQAAPAPTTRREYHEWHEWLTRAMARMYGVPVELLGNQGDPKSGMMALSGPPVYDKPRLIPLTEDT